jgi:hypothetical protein
MFEKGKSYECIDGNNNITKGKYYKCIDLDDDGDPIVTNDYGVNEGHYKRLFNPIPRNFMKSDLKTGMICVYKDMSVRLVLGNALVGMDGYATLDEFDDELKSNIAPRVNMDVFFVFNEPKIIRTTLKTVLTVEWVEKNCDLLWSRQPLTPEYTMEELVKMVGHNFKIKK